MDQKTSFRINTLNNYKRKSVKGKLQKESNRYQVNEVASVYYLVTGDDNDGLGVVDTRRQRFGAEPGEDDRVDGTDAGAGQHDRDGHRTRWHVDGHSIASYHPVLTQNVGHLVHQRVQLPVGLTNKKITPSPD